MMKKILFIFLASMLSVPLLAQWTRSGIFTVNGEHDDKTEPSSGLEKIFVFKHLATSTISYETSSSNTVKFYTYQNSIADKDPFPFSSNTPSPGDKTIYTVSNLQDNRGLLVEDNNKALAVWVIDYSLHKPKIHSIRAEESDDRCEALKLVIEKEDDLLEYRGIAGQVRAIKRIYDVSYQGLEWNDDNHEYVEKEIVVKDALNGTEIFLNIVPNMNTKFTIRGDQFAQSFGMVEEAISAEYEAVRVEAHIKAVQAKKDSENEEEQEETGLGGSAPVDIEFFGYGNKPVVSYYTWFVYDKKDMENPVARYTDKDFDYTFQQAGDYEVVLEVANAQSSCVSTERVNFNISISELKVPNFFSPGSSPGSHDEFKVYYKSLIKYHCVIFNRWGNKVFESRDPEQGWDGRYKGSLVNPGVYFYSIVAKGADGINYKRGGDINILR